jgi:hypothetical protein
LSNSPEPEDPNTHPIDRRMQIDPPGRTGGLNLLSTTIYNRRLVGCSITHHREELERHGRVPRPSV